MNINQYAVYQLKESAELAAYRSRSYQYLTEHHFQVIVQNYQQAYFTKLFTSDTPEMIRKRLEEHRPKNFRGRPFGVGDVIVINQQGEITAYFVDKDSLVVVAGFIRSSSSGILVTLDTKNLFIDGCAGTWMATEECVVESQHFFLMQHEVYKEKAPNVIVDASGKLVSTEIRKGLDEDARKKILDYLHVRTGKIQCIVVKDLSRFGRDYIETGSYLETIFPMLHVRFIAINDDFDNIRQSDVDSLAVPIKNMVNSLYAKDISKKISLSYQMRREKGIPTSWCTPYGYQLNEQGNKFEATEDAKWVKLIYQWYLAGVSTNEIARRLEFLEVARPNERLNRKLHEGDDPTYNKWHPSTVLRILNSSAYIGELVSGKTQTASYKGIGLHPVEKKEWHIVENAHEAIILKSDFEKVQARREQNKEKRERAMARSKATREKCYNHLSGMVYCGCCRRNMTFERRVHGTVKETHYGVFICKRKKNTTPCAYHAVPEKMLMMVAMDQIHHLVSTMCEEEKMVKDMMRGSNLDSARSIKMKENSILFRIQEAEERRLRLYEDYKAQILDEDEYSQLKEHYIAEKQRLEHELQKQRQRALELEKRIKICDAQMERMRGILNQNEFDEELVHELIKRIYVGMDNSVEVEFKCSDPYQEVLAIMSEVQNE